MTAVQPSSSGATKHIVVIGDLMEDVDEFCQVVKTKDGYPCLKTNNWTMRDGGAGAVAKMARWLGLAASLVCDVTRTCMKKRYIVDGQVVMRHDDDQRGYLPTGTLPSADMVVVADYGKGVIDAESWERITDCYQGIPIFAGAHHGKQLSFYAGAECIVTNDFEGLGGTAEQVIVQTRGEAGMWLHDQHGVSLIPAHDCRAIDPCGAGDMVLAALAKARLDGLGWAAACHYAAEQAARVCEVWGARPPDPV